ncbi:hypothetical protein ACIQXW_02345 [Lysinibacillus sp. NPDC097162]|uniref:hypothetical protein n=1 Tax=unclassified Lysinibacillus TaxID=2636778 RepID=UPI003809E65E
MKKLIIGTFTAILTTGLLFGCGNAKEKTEPNDTESPSTHKEHMDDQNKTDDKSKE